MVSSAVGTGGPNPTPRPGFGSSPPRRGAAAARLRNDPKAPATAPDPTAAADSPAEADRNERRVGRDGIGGRLRRGGGTAVAP